MIKLTIAINVLRERGRVQLENGLDESWKYGARLSLRDAQGKKWTKSHMKFKAKGPDCYFLSRLASVSAREISRLSTSLGGFSEKHKLGIPDAPVSTRFIRGEVRMLIRAAGLKKGVNP
jgi:hypothetical protein